MRRLGLLVLTFVACARGAATELAEPPAFEPEQQTKCNVLKSQTEPLVVEWPSAARAKLEAQLRRGAVVVRYVGCEMEVLEGCRAPSRYAYVGITVKHDSVRIRSEDELYASIPVYAARFAGELEKSGELGVEMTIVGRWEASLDSIHAGELHGRCSGATHMVTGLTVGAFDFYAGASASIGSEASVGDVGVGASSRAKRQLLNRDGDAARCHAAKSADRAPPDGCAAILRVEVVPVERGKRAPPPVSSVASSAPSSSASAPAPVAPPAPALPKVACPGGTKRRASYCAAQSFDPCPASQHLALGGGCTPELPPPSAVAPLPATAPSAKPGSLVRVSGGTFLMGSYDGQKDERPPRQVTVASFFMDVNEVTVAAYAECVASGGCRARELDPECNWGHPSRSQHPMNCVEWEEANAYCSWADRRLPSEEEWEYAARGSKPRRYPWGSETPMGRVCWKPLLSAGSTCAVGAYPAGATPLGIVDLAGNVHEWTSSTYCFSDTSGRRCLDGVHVHRGGSFAHPHELFVRATTRHAQRTDAAQSYGFRCAKSDSDASAAPE